MLDAELTGKLYVDGLQVLLPYISRGTFRYRYNLRQFRVGSGDGRVPDIPKRVAAIWKEAIQQREDAFLPKYVEILSETPHYLDVRHADKHVDSATAKKIWHFLQTGVDKGKFLYWGREGKVRCNLITLGSFERETQTIKGGREYHPKLWKGTESHIRSPVEYSSQRMSHSNP